MSLTFRRLEVFVAAAGEGNFRKTADRLGISQPSVSAQIHAIESHLGYALFDRQPGVSAKLSHAGSSFLLRAQHLVTVGKDLAVERQAARHAKAATLRVSVGPILLETRVKPGLMDFQERHPEIVLEFLPFDPSRECSRAIASGALDVVMYTGGPPPRGSPAPVETITRVACSIWGSGALPDRYFTAGADLSGAPFLLPARHYLLSGWLDRQLAAIGIRPRNVIARPPYMDVVLRMVIAGKGFAPLFNEHVHSSLESAQLRAIATPELLAYRIMALGHRAQRPAMRPALDFLRRAGAADTQHL